MQRLEQKYFITAGTAQLSTSNRESIITSAGESEQPCPEHPFGLSVNASSKKKMLFNILSDCHRNNVYLIESTNVPLTVRQYFFIIIFKSHSVDMMNGSFK